MWHEHRESIMFTVGLWFAALMIVLIIGFGVFCHFAGKPEKRKREKEEHEDGLLL